MSTTYGKGPNTPVKQDHLGKITGRIFATARAALRNHGCPDAALVYMDASAGPGYDKDGDPSGCIYILDAAARQRIPLHAILCEGDPRHATALSEVIAARYGSAPSLKIHVLHGLFGDLARPIADDIRAALSRAGLDPLWLFGCLYFDPCGEYRPADWRAIQHMARAYPRLDTLLHLSATSQKRIRGYLEKQHAPWKEAEERVTLLNNRIAEIPKNFWHVRAPLSWQQWTFILGTNYAGWRTYQGIKMFPLDSWDGQAILERIVYTADELKARTACPQAPIPPTEDT